MKCSETELKTRLIRKAWESSCRYRIAAAGIDHRGNIISMATNLPRFHRRGGGMHAEQRIMRSSPPTLDEIMIVRIGNAGDPRPIKPCPACFRKATELGVRIKTLIN